MTGQLDGERGELSAALSNLGAALKATKTFITTNRSTIADNVGILARVTDTLGRDRQSLATLLDVAALGLTNYTHIYDPRGKGFNARFTLDDKTDTPVMFACSLMASVGQSPQDCLKLLAPLAKIPLPASSGPGTLNGVLPGAGR